MDDDLDYSGEGVSVLRGLKLRKDKSDSVEQQVVRKKAVLLGILLWLADGSGVRIV